MKRATVCSCARWRARAAGAGNSQAGTVRSIAGPRNSIGGLADKLSPFSDASASQTTRALAAARRHSRRGPVRRRATSHPGPAAARPASRPARAQGPFPGSRNTSSRHPAPLAAKCPRLRCDLARDQKCIERALQGPRVLRSDGSPARHRRGRQRSGARCGDMRACDSRRAGGEPSSCSKGIGLERPLPLARAPHAAGNASGLPLRAPELEEAPGDYAQHRRLFFGTLVRWMGDESTAAVQADSSGIASDLVGRHGLARTWRRSTERR